MADNALGLIETVGVRCAQREITEVLSAVTGRDQ